MEYDRGALLAGLPVRLLILGSQHGLQDLKHRGLSRSQPGFQVVPGRDAKLYLGLGAGTDFYYATLSSSTPSTGTMSITFDDTEGGTFTSDLNVNFGLERNFNFHIST